MDTIGSKPKFNAEEDCLECGAPKGTYCGCNQRLVYDPTKFKLVPIEHYVGMEEFQRLRDDSEATRLLSTLKGKNGDIYFSTISGYCEVVEVWEQGQHGLSEYQIRVIASGPTPLAAVQAAKQKLEQEQG